MYSVHCLSESDCAGMYSVHARVFVDNMYEFQYFFLLFYFSFLPLFFFFFEKIFFHFLSYPSLFTFLFSRFFWLFTSMEFGVSS